MRTKFSRATIAVIAGISALATGATPVAAAPQIRPVAAPHMSTVVAASAVPVVPSNALSVVTPTSNKVVSASSKKPSITVTTSHVSLNKGEAMRLGIKFRTKTGKAAKSRTVSVFFRADSGKKWKKVAQAKTNSSGNVAVNYRPSKTGQLRLTATTSKNAKTTRSKILNISVKQGNRTLEERAGLHARELGSSTSAPSSVSKAKLKKTAQSIDAARLLRFKSASIVETTQDGNVDAWVVRGAINTAYMKANGPKGKYGVPVSDAKCGLIERGCVQQFTGGTIYSSSYKKAATGVTAKGTRGEILAAAASQVGYNKKWGRSSAIQYTKYNKWSGHNFAWCAQFVFWAADAAGNARYIPEVYRIPAQVKWVRKNWDVDKKPRVGDVAFIDSMGAGRPTHVGLVLEVRGNTVITVEGNTARAFRTGHRGVSKNVRSTSSILFFGHPEY